MAERVHVIGGDARWLQHRDALRWIARAVTGDQDINAEEGMAATYDQVFGGDDAMVGAAMTYLINGSNDPRAYVERVILACDLLRTARRTMH